MASARNPCVRLAGACGTIARRAERAGQPILSRRGKRCFDREVDFATNDALVALIDRTRRRASRLCEQSGSYRFTNMFMRAWNATPRRHG
jgi:hypothetical protein